MNLIPSAAALFKSDKIAKDFLKTPLLDDVQRAFLDVYVSSWPFDETHYLHTYPDIRPGMDSGDFSSAWAHFRKVGYFEGRLPLPVQVDADWYLARYTDVARILKLGQIASVEAHFFDHGYREGRLPQRPALQHRWYATRYLPGASPDQCETHYITVGYLAGNIPARPTM
jgi:hypothetical protein